MVISGYGMVMGGSGLVMSGYGWLSVVIGGYWWLRVFLLMMGGHEWLWVGHWWS